MFSTYRALAVISAVLFGFALMPGDAAALTCADLDGAYVVSQENPQIYLGFFGSQFALDSIENQFGPYGSPFNTSSVRDQFGQYGSPSGLYSANNQFTVTPPLIGRVHTAFALLTTNTLLAGGVSLATIDSACGTSFTSTQPDITALPPPAITIRPGLSGNWDNPTPGQDGHGFQFEILQNNGILVIWFVFTPDGTGQTWLYSQGSYDPTSNTVTLPAYLSLGPKFPPNYNVSDRHLTQWGNLTFTFADCNNAVVSWTSTAPGYPASGSFPIAHLTAIAGTTCP